MTMPRLPRPLRGIIPPMITPLSGPDTLDLPGLERLVEHILSGGVHGLFVLGTTGEAPSLSHKLREELVRRVCGQVAGRVPVLAGITDTAFGESLRMAEAARDAGASALVLAPPYYFAAGQPELLEYIGHLCDKLPLPLFLYNMPSHTKVVFEPDTVRQAAAIPGVVGLKDSGGDMTYFHRVRAALRGRRDFSLLIGPELLLAEAVLFGAHGGVCGGANVAPRLFVELWEAARAGRLARVRALQEKVMAVSELYAVGRHGSSYLKGLKCALSCMGICDDFLAEPFHRFRPPERRAIARRLRALKLPGVKAARA